MTMKRRIAAIAAVFLVSRICAILTHGFALARDYAPFHGRLLRPMTDDPGWPILMLPASHLGHLCW